MYAYQRCGRFVEQPVNGFTTVNLADCSMSFEEGVLFGQGADSRRSPSTKVERSTRCEDIIGGQTNSVLMSAPSAPRPVTAQLHVLKGKKDTKTWCRVPVICYSFLFSEAGMAISISAGGAAGAGAQARGAPAPTPIRAPLTTIMLMLFKVAPGRYDATVCKYNLSISPT
ncbi:hypothetical protein EVAR_28405_1 [Eumeta japonica]|uniref:Uncharacterized protein n=1 Tax=Eumeta variegata TaxID=151549 RepID=A0A4C1V8R4_EUMVA|nr:hypothetical protein EVAR_28405_1 [Eumeta japonica]